MGRHVAALGRKSEKDGLNQKVKKIQAHVKRFSVKVLFIFIIYSLETCARTWEVLFLIEEFSNF